MEVKSLTVIAKRTMPKTFRIILIPEAHKNNSMCLDDFNMIYTNIVLKKIVIIISNTCYSILTESKDLIVTAPAIIGNAKVTMDAVSRISSF